MWWVIPVSILAIFVEFILPCIVEERARRQKMTKVIDKNYKEIMDMKSDGLCTSCVYGIDECLKQGRALCKKEKENEQEKSI